MSDFLNFLFREFGIAAPFAPWALMSKSSKGMLAILACSQPFKITEAIIRFIAIKMVSLVTRRWRGAEKGKQYETMHREKPLLVVSRQGHAKISGIGLLWLGNMSKGSPWGASDTSHPSCVANLIITFIADYMVPLLFHNFLQKCKRHQEQLAVVTQQEPDGVIAKVRMMLSASILLCDRRIVAYA